MKIMMSAGEASGDLHGARLAKEMLEMEPDVKLFGFGGAKMAEAGVRLVRDCRDYSIMGVWEVVLGLGRLLQLEKTLVESMREEKPDLLLIIDYPDFNWRLAAKAKALGVPVFSYIPPSAWAWRKGRAKKCAAIAKEIVTIFHHEIGPYVTAGANVSFLGNPLVDTVRADMEPEAARAFFGLKDGERAALLLPGSRRQEISFLLPDMLKAVRILKEKRPETRFFLPVAPGLERQEIERHIEKSGASVELTEEHVYDLMGVADFAIATSGTVVMEAALMDLPAVVCYRMGRLNYAIGRMLVKIDHFSLPNIILGEEAEPELLQDEVTPERIAEEAAKLYKGEPQRDSVMARLKVAVLQLGPPGASVRVAAHVLAAAAGRGNEREA
ncbi:lipid-A-disaccharide synthase [Selenomonas sputigena]|uniref:Lipid-A-disaccharide synthase n=1 Tax=Selenomonas sputigena (strain ATCC 35185 / DSM 20758 / CCUG 44933 / VPI D19B-28) TaxID=546271 RepID=C9LRN5_SELS3|nr:lipid-A-disaccharide synthase [Selenomonas sputigena]AEC00856.1 lipid-A-disaccharide synthase [Selenomonas sputigena ATCC 35185]EEX78501.1 lipid-A-disaccharide synthase [Selenomonas sputigena ATCC 35185]